MVRMGTRFRRHKADEHYDVVVIGSGIGGLCNPVLDNLASLKCV